MALTLALLDADIIAYEAAAAFEEEFEGERQTDVVGAINFALNKVEEWTDNAGCDKPVLCFSDRDRRNFRKVVWPDYKSGRSEKPLAYWQVVEVLEERFRVERIPSLEGDDVIGVMHTSPKLADRSVMVSLDKDMKTIPGLLFNPAKDSKPRRISPKDAHAFWMMQTIMGDSTDGYGGCPGAGPAAAEAILASPHELRRVVKTISRGPNKGRQDVKWEKGGPTDLWSSICAYYRKAGLTEDDAILQARMARILHRDDYNKEEGLIYLWHPQTRKRQPLKLPTT